MVLLVEEYEQMKEEAINTLQVMYPHLNVRNLIKEEWLYDGEIPIFYLTDPNGM